MSDNHHGSTIGVWKLKCPSCGHEFERRGMGLNPTCPKCGKQAVKVRK